MVLYIPCIFIQFPYSCKVFFQVFILHELIGDVVVNVWLLGIATSVDYVLFDGSVKCNCVWSVVMGSLISYFGRVTVQIIVYVLQHGLWLVLIIWCWWTLWRFMFVSQFLVKVIGCLIVAMIVSASGWCTTCAGYILNGACSPRHFVET